MAKVKMTMAANRERAQAIFERLKKALSRRAMQPGLQDAARTPCGDHLGRPVHG